MRNLLWTLIITVFVIRMLFHFTDGKSYTDGTKLRIEGKLTTEPIRYDNSQYIKLSGFSFYLPTYPEISYGDIMVIEGVVNRKKLEKARLVELKENKNVLFKLRNSLLKVYERSLPNPHSALVAGVTVGSKANLGTEFWESLKNTGTAHVVVASGMNVTLVAGFLFSVLVSLFPRKRAIIGALIGIWAYALIAGFEAPIVRAAIMGTLTFVAQEVGRLNLATRSLFVSAVIMLIFKPLWISDLGYWLSFTATLSILLFNARVERMLRFIKIDFLRKDLSTSLAAQIGVAPIIYSSFGQLNIFSPLINAAVLWTIPFITIIGIVGGMLGLIFVPLGKVILLLVYPLTTWFIYVVSF